MRLKNVFSLSRTALRRSGLLLVTLACLANRPTTGQTDFCHVKAVAHADGSVNLDATRYADRAKLRNHLLEYRRRFPTCLMTLDADRGVSDGTMEQIGTVFREAGFATIGFLTEPRPVK